jgi:hypothetical protein
MSRLFGNSPSTSADEHKQAMLNAHLESLKLAIAQHEQHLVGLMKERKRIRSKMQTGMNPSAIELFCFG